MKTTIKTTLVLVILAFAIFASPVFATRSISLGTAIFQSPTGDGFLPINVTTEGNEVLAQMTIQMDNNQVWWDHNNDLFYAGYYQGVQYSYGTNNVSVISACGTTSVPECLMVVHGNGDDSVGSHGYSIPSNQLGLIFDWYTYGHTMPAGTYTIGFLHIHGTGYPDYTYSTAYLNNDWFGTRFDDDLANHLTTSTSNGLNFYLW